jgi:hypothetical protein
MSRTAEEDSRNRWDECQLLSQPGVAAIRLFTRAEGEKVRWCVLALALVAALAGADQFPLPQNVTVSSGLVAIVLDALKASPTFREQCERIGRMRLVRVTIDLDAAERPIGPVLVRAQTEIRRFQYGLILAAVSLWSTRDAAELVAHELEHVREFAEGVDYRSAAARMPRSVWMTGPNTFESTRATVVGRMVAGELAGSVTR